MNRLLEISAAEAYVKFYQKQIPVGDYNALTAMDPVTGNVPYEERQKGPYVEWLLKMYKKLTAADKKRMVTEDAESITTGLKLYHGLVKSTRGALVVATTTGKPIDVVRDIGRFDLGDIRMLAAKQDQMSGETTSLSKRIEVIYNGEALFVCIPETHEAARKYGTGTNWCTATSNPKWFESYAKRGKLIIIINKQDQKEKWQYHWDQGARKSMFADARDKAVSVGGTVLSLIKRDGAMADDIDAVAQILGEQLGYDEWKADNIVQGKHDEFKLILQKTGPIKKSTVQQIRIDGLSLLGYALANNYLTAVDFLLEEIPTLHLESSDFVTVFHNEDALAVMQTFLGYMRPEHVEGLLMGIASSQLNFSARATASYEKAPVLRSLYRKLAEYLPLSARRSLLVSNPNVVSQTMINQLAERSYGDSLLYDLITVLFPELVATTPLQERYVFKGEDSYDAYNQKLAQQWRAGAKKSFFAADDSIEDELEEVKTTLTALVKDVALKLPTVAKLLSIDANEDGGWDIVVNAHVECLASLKTMSMQQLLARFDAKKIEPQLDRSEWYANRVTNDFLFTYFAGKAPDLPWGDIVESAWQQLQKKSLVEQINSVSVDHLAGLLSVEYRRITKDYADDEELLDTIDHNLFVKRAFRTYMTALIKKDLKGYTLLKTSGPSAPNTKLSDILTKNYYIPLFNKVGLGSIIAKVMNQRVDTVETMCKKLRVFATEDMTRKGTLTREEAVAALVKSVEGDIVPAMAKYLASNPGMALNLYKTAHDWYGRRLFTPKSAIPSRDDFEAEALAKDGKSSDDGSLSRNINGFYAGNVISSLSFEALPRTFTEDGITPPKETLDLVANTNRLLAAWASRRIYGKDPEESGP